MPAIVLVTFFVVFLIVLLSVSAGTKFFEARRKQRMASMIETASGQPTVTVATLLKELEPERPGGIKGVLNSLQFSRHARMQLQQAGLDWSSSRLIGAMALAAIPGLGLGTLLPILMNGPVTAIALALLGALIPYLIVRQKRIARLARFEDQFPEALDFLARSMRAGHAFTISLEMLGGELADPLGQEIRALFNEHNLGAPLDIALRNFTERVPLLDARFFTSTVLLQKQTGGNLSEILTRLAWVIRERFRLKGQVRAASAHGRLTATVLTLMPIGTMIALLVVAPGYLQNMARDPDGRWMIGGAIAAQILGNYFIKRIINIKV
jgi:tight adherence protein B